jgi:hypothetical protein
MLEWWHHPEFGTYKHGRQLPLPPLANKDKGQVNNQNNIHNTILNLLMFFTKLLIVFGVKAAAVFLAVNS